MPTLGPPSLHHVEVSYWRSVPKSAATAHRRQASGNYADGTLYHEEKAATKGRASTVWNLLLGLGLAWPCSASNYLSKGVK